jgi:hypothetical protein
MTSWEFCVRYRETKTGQLTKLENLLNCVF